MLSFASLENATLVRQRRYSSRRHGRKAAGLEPQVDDLDQRHPGADTLRRDIVHLDIAVVADDQAVVGVEEAQSLRHVVDGGVELEVPDAQRFFLRPAEFVLFLQPGIELLALGDVLVGRHPAAAGHRIDGVGDDPAVGEFLDGGGECDIAPDARADVVIRRRGHLEAEVRAGAGSGRWSGVPGFTCSVESPYIST